MTGSDADDPRDYDYTLLWETIVHAADTALLFNDFYTFKVQKLLNSISVEN